MIRKPIDAKPIATTSETKENGGLESAATTAKITESQAAEKSTQGQSNSEQEMLLVDADSKDANKSESTTKLGEEKLATEMSVDKHEDGKEEKHSKESDTKPSSSEVVAPSTESDKQSVKSTGGDDKNKSDDKKSSMESLFRPIIVPKKVAPVIILQCESKLDAQSWAKEIRDRATHLNLVDGTADCKGDVDITEMTCLLANIDTENAIQDFKWLQGYSAYLLGHVVGAENSAVVTKALKNINSEGENKLIKLAKTPVGTAETVGLPMDGLVVVAVQYVSDEGEVTADSPVLPVSLWLKVHPGSNQLMFYDHGPDNVPCLVISCEESIISLREITHPQELLVEIKNCRNEESDYLSIVFTFTTSVDYWKWALTLAYVIKPPLSISMASSSSAGLAEDSRNEFIQIVNFGPMPGKSDELTPSIVKNVIWTDYMLDVALDAVGCLAEFTMCRSMMKSYHLTGFDCRNISFGEHNGRIVVQSSDNDEIIPGSVVITLNEISAIGMPGRSLKLCISQIPLHMDVEMLAWEFSRDVFEGSVLVLSAKRSALGGMSEDPVWEAAALGGVHLRSNQGLLSRIDEYGDEQKVSQSHQDAWANLMAGRSSQKLAIGEKVNKPNLSTLRLGVDASSNSTNMKGFKDGSRLWISNMIIRLDSGKLTISPSSSSLARQMFSHSFDLTRLEVRLIDTHDDENIKTALNVAIEMRDLHAHVAVGFASLKVTLQMFVKLVQCMRLLGAVPMDLTKFHSKCVTAKNTPIASPSRRLSFSRPQQHLPILPSHNESPVKGNILAATQSGSCSRLDVMKSAQALEAVLESLHISDNFPTTTTVLQVNTA